MSDEIKFYKGFVVTFDQGFHEDDIRGVIDAIKMFRGVVSVKPIEENVDDLITRERAYYAIRRDIARWLELTESEKDYWANHE